MQFKKRGFTVVEILLVTAILLLVTAFSVPTVFAKIQDAKDAAAGATLHNLESVCRFTSALLLLEETPPARAVSEGQPYTLHIPTRLHEVRSAYADFYEQSIAEAFGQALPAYEITETYSTELGSALCFRYWPEPQKKPTLCYQLQNGAVTRLRAQQPAPHARVSP